ncbi:c-type cytochrome [Nitrospina watsonii]|uniref:Cytochrome c-552 n=1 Tax=Nitrospina watsonii TaxID=1323948 RepID=A0ABN8W4M4_9BACT|nr:cytochrome c [Nitrospina watsonii]CAI2718586.1 Putative Cytochrome c-552 [Nitrospina watsonii]
MFWTRTSLILSLSVLSLAACAPQPTKSVPAEFKRGQELFHQVCSNCHGSDALGGHTKAPNLIDAVFVKSEFSDQEFRHTITNGTGKMPAQKGKFSDEEITEIIKYLRHSQKEANLVIDAEDMDDFYDAPLPVEDPITEQDVKDG